MYIAKLNTNVIFLSETVLVSKKRKRQQINRTPVRDSVHTRRRRDIEENSNCHGRGLMADGGSLNELSEGEKNQCN